MLGLLATGSPRAIGEVTILEKGPDHRVVQELIGDPNLPEQVVTRAWIELCTGLHFWNGDDWETSHASFQAVPGMAVARRTQHQVTLHQNINGIGSVQWTTSDARPFRSTPLFVALRDPDTGEAAAIATLQDSEAEILGENQVLYRDCMAGISCTLRFTVGLQLFEQDLVLHEPISAEDWDFQEKPGLLVELWTEVYEVPPLHATRVGQAGELSDVTLDFGTARIGAGKAFTLGREDLSIPVAKRFGVVPELGRTFLVESVTYEGLKALQPQEARIQPGKQRPDRRVQKVRGDKSLIAQASAPNRDRSRETAVVKRSSQGLEPGVVWDYQVLTGTTNSLTLRGDLTYYVSGTYTLSGTLTAEGGAVVKYAPSNNAKIKASGPVVFKTSSARPVLFTGRDDHSVGEKIGSAAFISAQQGLTALEIDAVTSGQSATLEYLGVRYFTNGIVLNGRMGHLIKHAQLVNCSLGIQPIHAEFSLRNALFHNVTTNLMGTGSTGRLEHITVNTATVFNHNLTQVNLTNSILAGVTTLGSYTAQNVETPASPSSVFEAVGAGFNYLANNTYRNQGTINVSILAELRKLTTYAPSLWTAHFQSDQRISPQAMLDIDPKPALGFHYSPIDYAVSSQFVSASLTLTNGVSVAIYGTNGWVMQEGGKLISFGKPDSMNRLFRYSAVQEQPMLWGGNLGGSLLEIASYSSTAPEIRFRFTDVSMLGSAYMGADALFKWAGTAAGLTWLAQDSRFRGVYLDLLNATSGTTMNAHLTNNVFERSRLGYWNGYSTVPFPFNLSIRNNLFKGGSAEFGVYTPPSGGWEARDNLFDSMTIVTNGNNFSNSYNGYWSSTRLPGTSGGDKILTAADYESGLLSSYYYPTSTPSGTNLNSLRNVGSIANAGTVGFYHFVTTTNQSKETNTVIDIGAHFVAWDLTQSQPVDSDKDGTPDYLEDRNGNGTADSGENSWLSYNSPHGLTNSGVEILVFTPLR